MRLQGMAHWAIWNLAQLFENIGIVQDGINTFSLSSAVKDLPNAKDLIVKKGEIEFKNLSFSYNKDENVFFDFFLKINSGQKVGLIGYSGAGKSTLVSLLLRFYDPNSGSIEIDNQNIKQVTQDSLRQQISVVTQDSSLLNRSIKDNIAYGNKYASDEEIIRAAKLAGAHEFIVPLKDANGKCGYEAFVGERGVKLSGGQRQRISIARVVLKNSPILVLDEATSALDSEAENTIQESFKKIMHNKTVVAIAHRLSTIAALDRLIVIQEGKIIEDGTHEELLTLKGVYASLWEKQVGGFLGKI
jgi:ATP-binding cassette, subfamily B, multidrug efflux pump